MPTTPDSIPARSVQVDDPSGPWDRPLDPLTEGSKTAASFFTETGKDDLLAALWRDGADLRFRDETNPGSGNSGYTLSEILSGGSGLTADQHKVLRQLIHFIDEGPAEGFASGAYKEVLPTGNPFPTSIIWWESSGKTQKIVEKLITRSGGAATNVKPTPIKWKVYDTDGTTVLWTITDAIVYSGIVESTRTRTITSGDA